MKPIIILPGLFASIPDPGSRYGYSLGFSEKLYNPLIDGLCSLGYKKEKDLFVAYYPWWRRVKDIPANYLKPVIDRAMKINDTDGVVLIGHSMGGLVARAYVQSDDYRYDVSKLIMLGTPNAGAANAYYAWEGGDLAPTPEFDITNAFYKAFVWMLSFQHVVPHPKDIVRKYIKSVRDLMPVKEYGSYIFTYKNNDIRFIPIREMHEANGYLTGLNKNFDILDERCRPYLLGGIGYYTNEYIQVSARKNKLWEDGKPEGVVRNLKGDGTVLLKSLSLDKETVKMKSMHAGLMENCIGQIADILKLNYSGRHIPKKMINYISMIVPKGTDILRIEDNPKLEKVSVDGKFDWYMAFNVERKDYRFNIKEIMPSSKVFIDTPKMNMSVYKSIKRSTSEIVIRGEDII